MRSSLIGLRAATAIAAIANAEIREAPAKGPEIVGGEADVERLFASKPPRRAPGQQASIGAEIAAHNAEVDARNARKRAAKALKKAAAKQAAT